MGEIGVPAWGNVILTSTPLTHTNSQQAPWCVWLTQFTGAACAAGTAETNIEMAIDTTATATERRIKRRMVSASLCRSGTGRHGPTSIRSGAKHWRSAPELASPTIKGQRCITPGLACACGLYLGDRSARSQQRP